MVEDVQYLVKLCCSSSGRPEDVARYVWVSQGLSVTWGLYHADVVSGDEVQECPFSKTVGVFVASHHF